MLPSSMMDAKGQAMIEFIFFLPLFFLVYSFIQPYMQSVYASINQQKVTRHYFYYYLKNHSFFPKPEYDFHLSLRSFGMTFIGFAGSFNNTQPIATCYKMMHAEEDNCKKSYSKPETDFIRIATVYGACGATYIQEGGKFFLSPFKNAQEVNSKEGCILQ